MSKIQAGRQSVCSFVLVILCLSGCGPNTTGGSGAQRSLTVLHVADKKVDVEILTKGTKRLSIYVGDKKWGSGPVWTDKKTLATLEVSDQISLEGGSMGHGMIFTTGSGVVSQFLALTEDGALPYGKVKIRDAMAVLQSGDTVTLADIETPDGSLVPISFRLE